MDINEIKSKVNLALLALRDYRQELMALPDIQRLAGVQNNLEIKSSPRDGKKQTKSQGGESLKTSLD